MRAATALSASESKAHFLQSLSSAREEAYPYRHWFLHQVFTEDVLERLNDLPLSVPQAEYVEGSRAENNKLRAYFSGDNLENLPACRHVADLFQDQEVVQRIAEFSGARIDGSYLRIEYAQDTDGFWLTPHTDIGAKFFTLLIYLNEPHPGEEWGTDVYVDADTHHGVAGFQPNAAFMFVPGDDTWHGFEKRTITGVRRSLIVNYVTTEWRARHELAFPDETVRVAAP